MPSPSSVPTATPAATLPSRPASAGRVATAPRPRISVKTKVVRAILFHMAMLPTLRSGSQDLSFSVWAASCGILRGPSLQLSGLFTFGISLTSAPATDARGALCACCVALHGLRSRAEVIPRWDNRRAATMTTMGRSDHVDVARPGGVNVHEMPLAGRIIDVMPSGRGRCCRPRPRAPWAGQSQGPVQAEGQDTAPPPLCSVWHASRDFLELKAARRFQESSVWLRNC